MQLNSPGQLLLPLICCIALPTPTTNPPLRYSLSQTLKKAAFAITSFALMDSGACKNLCGEAKESCLRSSQKQNEGIIIIGANKDVSELPDAAESNGSLVPITPDADRENGDFRIDLQSPLTVMKKPFKLPDIDSKKKEEHFDHLQKMGPPIFSFLATSCP